MTSTRASDWRTLVPPFVVSVADTIVLAMISSDGGTTRRSGMMPSGRPSTPLSEIIAARTAVKFTPSAWSALPELK